MSGESILHSEGLSVGYRAPVLREVNLDFGSGQFIALLGPNGAGKTTLLRTLSRHLKPLAGRVEVLGRDLNTLSALELARLVAVCLTDNAKPPLLSVDEFVALGRYPHTGMMGRLSVHDAEIVERSLAAVTASGLSGRLVEQLSDGERQKVVLARALAQEPKLMLLDEPTAHLDLKHRIEVMGILRSLCRSHGLTVLASLHDIDVAAKVSDRVLLVQNGGIRDYGLPETVLTGETVAELYGFGDADFNRHLGSIEFRGDGKAGRVFVIAGRGRAAPVFRLLSKKGLAIETGLLRDGDLDAFVAAALGAKTYVRAESDELPANGNGSSLEEAAQALTACDFIVDSGVRDAGAEALRQRAAASGLPVFRVAGGAEKGGITLSELLAAIDRLPPFPRQASQ
ncbi:ABC transporter ATP-binding protein [Dentiradicibacter hellwigii]|uniref:ABC transporter ATP-binding protein n=1 Tax=Dentiradicibacter hellwigii TaxID=3149053 RepID=A0ABV4UEE2_9RHOO